MKNKILMVVVLLLLLSGCHKEAAFSQNKVYGFCPSLGIVQGSRDGNFYYLETPLTAQGGGCQLLLAHSDYGDALFVSLRLSDLNDDHTGFIDRFYGREDIALPTVSADAQPLKRLTYSVGDGGYDTDELLSEDDVYLDYSGTFQLDAISEEMPLQVEWMGLTLTFTLPAHPGADAIEALGALLTPEDGVSLVAINGIYNERPVLYLTPYTDGSVYKGAAFGVVNYNSGARLVHRITGETVVGTLTLHFASAVFAYTLPADTVLSDYNLQVQVGLNLSYESSPVAVSKQSEVTVLELEPPYRVEMQNLQISEQNGDRQLSLTVSLISDVASPLMHMRVYALLPDETRLRLLPLDDEGRYVAAYDGDVDKIAIYVQLDNVPVQCNGQIPLVHL